FLNAFVICSACIPAYLLVRRVSGRAAAAWFVAVATLCVPWLVLSSFLLTEVAAYPAFLWAVYALQLASDDPSWRRDMLALRGMRASALRRHALAVLAPVTLLALIAEVTVFDLRFGVGGVRDRYLFYAAPLVLAGFACALVRPPWPRWSLAAPALLVALGFGAARLPRYDKLNVDTPVSVVDDALVRSSQPLPGARIFLL